MRIILAYRESIRARLSRCGEAILAMVGQFVRAVVGLL